MTTTSETKHEKFLRLMQKRLLRALDEIRLVGQLASTNYESFEEERLEVVQHLTNAVSVVANGFDVIFEAQIGQPDPNTPVELPAMSQAKIQQVIDHLDYGGISEALEILRKSVPASQGTN